MHVNICVYHVVVVIIIIIIIIITREGSFLFSLTTLSAFWL